MAELNKILDMIKEYYEDNKKELPRDKVLVSGKVYDSEELKNIVKCALEGWWTEGRWNEEFENGLKEYLGVKCVITVNSGSSANLVALKALTSVKLKDKRIKRGDEVITISCTFPTTLNPIIEIGAVPVFVDVGIGTYNAKINEIEKAIGEKTKAIFLPHTLGNPFDIGKVKELCKKHNLWLIEDNCDALGSKYKGKFTGTFGDFATLSFYPAHQITTAEGGAVLTNNPELYKIAKSMRDWGRDCWCRTGKENSCGKRFSWELGELPYGYDHKYIYSEIGYNLKMTDLQAAIGVAQLDKLDGFIEKRKENFRYLMHRLKAFWDYFIFPIEEKDSESCWFGFPLTIKNNKINREEFLKFLNERGVATRLLFAGNITKQPYFLDYGIKHRKVSELKNSDIVMKNTFWIGVYPGLEKEHIDFIYETFEEYIMDLRLRKNHSKNGQGENSSN